MKFREVAYMIEAKLAAARSFRPTVDLSGRFGTESPGAMLDDAPRSPPHRASAFLLYNKSWSSAEFGRGKDVFRSCTID